MYQKAAAHKTHKIPIGQHPVLCVFLRTTHTGATPCYDSVWHFLCLLCVLWFSETKKGGIRPRLILVVLKELDFLAAVEVNLAGHDISSEQILYDRIDLPGASAFEHDF